MAGSEFVRVIGNELTFAPTGLEITVSNEVLATQNDIHHNTVGVGLYHPNAAGNPPKDVMANWVIEHNRIYDNNEVGLAPDGTFQALLPPGVGVLLLGVDDHVIGKNTVENNGFAGIAVLGWCTAVFGTPRSCDQFYRYEDEDPSADNNLVYLNKLDNNGFFDQSPIAGIPTADILYLQSPLDTLFGGTGGAGNCFEKNKPKNGFTFFSSEPDGELPTDGC